MDWDRNQPVYNPRAGTQLKARTRTEREFIQVGNEPAHTERKPIQLERKHAMLKDVA